MDPQNRYAGVFTLWSSIIFVLPISDNRHTSGDRVLVVEQECVPIWNRDAFTLQLVIACMYMVLT